MESWRQAEAPVAQEERKKGCGRQAEAWCKIAIADTTTERLALFNLFFIFAITYIWTLSITAKPSLPKHSEMRKKTFPISLEKLGPLKKIVLQHYRGF